MTITVAGNKKEVADNLTVAQLIIDENVETPEYVTVTINDEFVKSGTFEETTLKDGDVAHPPLRKHCAGAPRCSMRWLPS